MKRKNKDKEEKDVVEQIKEEIMTPVTASDIRKLSTGCTLLDLTIGGGYPVGKIINLVGDKSSGKTLLAAQCIAESRYHLGDTFKWYYDDAEAGYSFDTELMYGFDMYPDADDTNDYISETVDDFSAKLTEQLDLIKDKETFIYILDSFDGLTSDEEIEIDRKKQEARKKGKKLEKGSYKTGKVRDLNMFFRLKRKQIKVKDCLLFIISQVRQNIGVMFGEKYTCSGGEALSHYAAQRIWLAECEKYRTKGIVTGVCTKVRIKKNKTGKAFRECFIDILFDYGIDNVSTNIKYLYDLKTPTGKDKAVKKGDIVWDGKEYTLKSLIKHIEENNLQRELDQRVIRKWNEIEDAISPKDRVSKYKREEVK